MYKNIYNRIIIVIFFIIYVIKNKKHENFNSLMKCPLCKKNVDKWLPYSSRKNVACPHCNSAERHRLTSIYLKKKKYNFFLHVAPERLLTNIFKKSSNNYICGDINPIRYKDMNAIYLDITDIKYQNNYFDCIYASHILEHIIEDMKAMKEMYRVLKKNGELLALIPQKLNLEKTYENNKIETPEDRKKYFGQWDHVRLYGLDFSKKLKSCGFYIKIFCLKECEPYLKKMYYDEKYIIGNNLKNIFNLDMRDILYVCIKK